MRRRCLLAARAACVSVDKSVATLEARSRGYAVPDTFTHGTSEQRVHWFSVGLKTGSVGACDTFAQQSP